MCLPKIYSILVLYFISSDNFLDGWPVQYVIVSVVTNFSELYNRDSTLTDKNLMFGVVGMVKFSVKRFRRIFHNIV